MIRDMRRAMVAVLFLIVVSGVSYYFYSHNLPQNSVPTVVSSPTIEVSFVGTLEVKKLNGEDVLFLELSQPVNIQGSGGDALHQGSYSGITEIQLVSSPVVMDLSDTSGQKSRVTGILEDAKNKAQYTPVILHIHTMQQP